jgi:hypothetical protein
VYSDILRTERAHAQDALVFADRLTKREINADTIGSEKKTVHIHIHNTWMHNTNSIFQTYALGP